MVAWEIQIIHSKAKTQWYALNGAVSSGANVLQHENTLVMSFKYDIKRTMLSMKSIFSTAITFKK